jgi:hypothetical protein
MKTKENHFLRGLDLRSSAQISGKKSALFRVFPQPAKGRSRELGAKGQGLKAMGQELEARSFLRKDDHDELFGIFPNWGLFGRFANYYRQTWAQRVGCVFGDVALDPAYCGSDWVFGQLAGYGIG